MWLMVVTQRTCRRKNICSIHRASPTATALDSATFLKRIECNRECWDLSPNPEMVRTVVYEIGTGIGSTGIKRGKIL